jgi:hypothetical protein
MPDHDFSSIDHLLPLSVKPFIMTLLSKKDVVQGDVIFEDNIIKATFKPTDSISSSDRIEYNYCPFIMFIE